HEIGHIIGARHDLGLDKMMTPFAYGHGYVNGTKWRDIMSYKESCGGCPRVPVWSSPTVLVRGEPASQTELHNASVIREHARHAQSRERARLPRVGGAGGRVHVAAAKRQRAPCHGDAILRSPQLGLATGPTGLGERCPRPSSACSSPPISAALCPHGRTPWPR